MSNNLTIEQVTITDVLTERAKTCMTVLAPLSRVGAPAAEFQFPGDTQQLSGTHIRPNGSIIHVAAGYGNVPQQTIFSGTVEVMDDLENPDLYTYNIVLSEIPASQNHRTKLTILYDLLWSAFQGSASTTTHAVLADACKKAGVPLGRIDLPNVQCIGNYEVIRKNICEIAEDLCSPFNQFDYMHYFVRVSERDGLSIIGVDYTKAGGVDNTYELLNVEDKTRTFQRYMPDNKIGTSDILLIGADRYSSLSGEVTLLGPPQIPPRTIITEPVISYRTLTHTYESDSRTDSYKASKITPGTQERTPEAWIETETTMEFVIREVYAPGPITIITSGLFMDHVHASQESGQVSFEVLESYTTKVEVRSYEYQTPTGGAAGFQQAGVERTDNTYAYIKFSEQVYKPGDLSTHVLVGTTVQCDDYIDNSLLPATLVRTTYDYDPATGAQISRTTFSYYYDARHSWVLDTSSAENTASPNIRNSSVVLAGFVSSPEESPPITYTGGSPTNLGAARLAPKPSALLGKYQLLDGAAYERPMTALINPNTGQFVVSPGTAPADTWSLRVLNINSAPLRAIPTTANNAALPGYDPTASDFDVEQLEKRCFQMSIPYMDYAGLSLIWAMCKRQQQLERMGVYWEIIKATASIDTTPAAGESIVVAGSSGICDSVAHTITPDSATTTLSIRRLITAPQEAG